MATQYGVTVTNKFALAILDDEEDPFEVLNHQEELKKQQDEKEKASKGKTTGKNKQAKKSVPQENKNKPQEPVAQKKEGNCMFYYATRKTPLFGFLSINVDRKFMSMLEPHGLAVLCTSC